MIRPSALGPPKCKSATTCFFSSSPSLKRPIVLHFPACLPSCCLASKFPGHVFSFVSLLHLRCFKIFKRKIVTFLEILVVCLPHLEGHWKPSQIIGTGCGPLLMTAGLLACGWGSQHFGRVLSEVTPVGPSRHGKNFPNSLSRCHCYFVHCDSNPSQTLACRLTQGTSGGLHTPISSWLISRLLPSLGPALRGCCLLTFS